MRILGYVADLILITLIYFHKKRYFAAPLKENKTFFMKKDCGFIDSEFMKICHEQVIICQIRYRISANSFHGKCVKCRNFHIVFALW